MQGEDILGVMLKECTRSFLVAHLLRNTNVRGFIEVDRRRKRSEQVFLFHDSFDERAVLSTGLGRRF